MTTESLGRKLTSSCASAVSLRGPPPSVTADQTARAYIIINTIKVKADDPTDSTPSGLRDILIFRLCARTEVVIANPLHSSMTINNMCTHSVELVLAKLPSILTASLIAIVSENLFQQQSERTAIGCGSDEVSAQMASYHYKHIKQRKRKSKMSKMSAVQLKHSERSESSEVSSVD